MHLSISKWRPAHLLGAWGAYWAGLVAVKLGPGISAIARLQSPGSKGSATFSFSDTELSAKVLDGATIVWQGTATLTEVALWVTLPPLALWAVWMMMRPSRSEVRAEAMLREPTHEEDARVLGQGAARPLATEVRAEDGVRGRHITPDPAHNAPPTR